MTNEEVLDILKAQIDTTVAAGLAGCVNYFV